MIPQVQLSIILYCDNNKAVAQSKDSRNYKGEKHIERKYHFMREVVRSGDVIVIVRRGDVIVIKIASVDNLADQFTNALTSNVFQLHVDSMSVRSSIFWT